VVPLTGYADRFSAAPGETIAFQVSSHASEPGEYSHSFDGQYGGLWRRNGRPPQQLAGVGFTSQGIFEGSYYRRQPGADDPRAAWVFAGVEDEHALILATSEAHKPEHFVVVHEEMLTMYNTVPGLPAELLIRADMVYFETPNGGAVFSVGSITFCGSLAHHHYDNNISRIVNNVLTRFRE